MHMTKEQEKEVRRYLEMKGISSDCIDGAVKSIRFHEETKALRDSDEVKRGRDIMKFKPNPGKATLTQVGETQTYLGGDDRGLPIYQEDVDMIKKALPLAKRLIELQKAKPQEPVEEKPLSEMTPQERIDNWFAKGEKEEQTLRTLRDTIDEVYDVKPEELNMGPDTTENIHEISEEDRMNLEAGWYKVPDQVKESFLKSRGIKKNENMTLDDMTYIHTPKSDEKIRRAATGFTAERQTDFPGAGDWKEWRKEHEDVLEKKMKEEDIRDSGDVMFGVDLETQGLKNEAPLTLRKYEDLIDLQHDTRGRGIIDDKPYPTTEEMKKYIDEHRNKNVSQDEDKKDPGDYYRYSNILKRMDDTHTRKNNDYGDAAYQGYKKYGDYYFMVQLHNKLSRLESLTIGNKTQQVKEESIDDTLLDMANYAVMYLESRHRDD